MTDRKEILVIEDQEQNLYLMKYILEANGYAAILATDGRGGIRAAKSHRPDLILLDIQLPTISGYDVAREIRADEKMADTPIVAVTSFAMPGDREDALEAGCTGYIEKPIDPERFIGQIEAFMKDSPAGGGERSGRDEGDVHEDSDC